MKPRQFPVAEPKILTFLRGRSLRQVEEIGRQQKIPKSHYFGYIQGGLSQYGNIPFVHLPIGAI